MGLLGGIIGNASDASIESLQDQFGELLVDGEIVEAGYKLVRDMIVLTNKRLIVLDIQGVTGRKQEFLTIPYARINRFAKESSGLLDLDAELSIWVNGQSEPIKKTFSKDGNVNEAYRILSKYVLG